MFTCAFRIISRCNRCLCQRIHWLITHFIVVFFLSLYESGLLLLRTRMNTGIQGRHSLDIIAQSNSSRGTDVQWLPCPHDHRCEDPTTACSMLSSLWIQLLWWRRSRLPKRPGGLRRMFVTVIHSHRKPAVVLLEDVAQQFAVGGVVGVPSNGCLSFTSVISRPLSPGCTDHKAFVITQWTLRCRT